MTKHGDSPIANGDRPALTSEVSEFGESFDRIAGELSQSFERSKNALTLKGLSFCEAYIEGRARIAVEFRANSAIEADGGSLFSIWAYKGHALNAAPGRNSGWREKGEAVYNHRSEEHTSELQSLMRISYADFCLKKNNKNK